MRHGARLLRRSRFARLALATFAVAPLAALVATRSPNAQTPQARFQAPPNAGQTGRGDTYYRLEREARRVTTRFDDSEIVSERDSAGRITTRVHDRAGNEVATLDVDAAAAAGPMMQFRAHDGRQLHATVHASVHATLDWGNAQAYSLWKDLRDERVIEWQNEVARPRGAPARDITRAIVGIRTDWPGGFAATSRRYDGPRPHVVSKREFNGHALIGRLQRDGIDVGSSRWYAEEQVLAWSFPGLTTGDIDAKRLDPVGGWSFTPDAAWMNVQNYAFYQFHSMMKQQGFVARDEGWLHKIGAALVPTVYANEEGCDGLHWLDYTILRPCCDNHDRCYAKSGCSSRSWWQWWSSWQCDFCNLSVSFCFMSGAQYPYYPDPYVFFW